MQLHTDHRNESIHLGLYGGDDADSNVQEAGEWRIYSLVSHPLRGADHRRLDEICSEWRDDTGENTPSCVQLCEYSLMKTITCQDRLGTNIKRNLQTPALSRCRVVDTSQEAVGNWWNAPEGAPAADHVYKPCEYKTGAGKHECNPTCGGAGMTGMLLQ